MIIYLDPSALGGIYLGDQADHASLSEILFAGDEPVITSELTDVEIASAIARAHREGAIDRGSPEHLLPATPRTRPTAGRWV